MKKLTKAQQEEQEKVRLDLIEQNAPILFDIESAIADGKQFKAELDELKRSNDAIVQTQKERCLKDFKTLQDFLGVYKDLAVMHDVEDAIRDDHFGFIVGSGLEGKKPIHFSYHFGREWWGDSDNKQVINGKEHQVYYPEDIEIWCDSVGETESFSSLESVFNDNDYVLAIENLLREYIKNL